MRAVFEVIDGPGAGRTHSCEEDDVVLIGRSPRCHFQVGRDLACSRTHLIVRVAFPACSLRDLQTRNGTTIGGVAVKEGVLRDGDEVRIGTTTLRLRFEGTPEPAETEAALREPVEAAEPMSDEADPDVTAPTVAEPAGAEPVEPVAPEPELREQEAVEAEAHAPGPGEPEGPASGAVTQETAAPEPVEAEPAPGPAPEPIDAGLVVPEPRPAEHAEPDRPAADPAEPEPVQPEPARPTEPQSAAPRRNPAPRAPRPPRRQPRAPSAPPATSPHVYLEPPPVGSVGCFCCGAATEAVGEDDGWRITVCSSCTEHAERSGAKLPGYRFLEAVPSSSLGALTVVKPDRAGNERLLLRLVPDTAVRSRRSLRAYAEQRDRIVGLRHGGIARTIAAGAWRDTHFVLTEMVLGTDLEQARTLAGGRLPSGRVVAMGLQALAALAYAHEQGVLHRDVCPANLVQGSADASVVLTDFGLARLYDAVGRDVLTMSGHVTGSVPFMAPEIAQSRSRADGRADLFGLAATLRYLLTGECCYRFDALRKDPLATIVEDDILPVEPAEAHVAPAVAEVLNRALLREPDDRYETAGEMLAALRSAAQ